MENDEIKRSTTDISCIPWTTMLDDYRLSLEALNRSPRTISWYLDILTRYFLFLESNGRLKPIHQLGTYELRAYLLHLRESTRWSGRDSIKKDAGKLSPYSILGHVRAVKAFWSWLNSEGYINQNVLTKFPLPKVPQNLMKILSVEEIKKLLVEIDRTTALGRKYYCILLVLLDAGVRISELISIRLQDIDSNYGLIQVLGKGQKQRIVPISRFTRREMVHYLSYYRLRLCPVDSPYLFPRATGEPISVNSVQQFLRRLAEKAGLDGVKCSPHVFRHTAATMSLTNGANVLTLKHMLGHASLATTQKYVHLQPKDLQNQHANFSPVANLDIGKITGKGARQNGST